MSNRKLVVVIFLLIGVFLIVKYDLLTMAKVQMINMIYGTEINKIKSFSISAVIPPHMEKDGLTAESICENMASMLDKASIRCLTKNDGQTTPDNASLTISVQALQQPDQQQNYQYIISLEVTNSLPKNNETGTSQEKKIWSASEAGLGNISDIRKEISNITNEFLKAQAGG